MTPARIAVAVGVSIALLAGAFSIGRFTAPVVTETRDVERVVYKDRVVEKVVTVQAAAKVVTRVVYRDKVTTPDGTITERETETTGEHENTDTTTETDTVADRASETVTEHTKTVTLRPQWRVSLLTGASLRDPFIPLAGPLVLGAEVDYRIAGGLSAGLWVNTVGAAGLSLALEF